MNEPRPAMISARPPEIRSSSANCWNTRTGSSELSTVTALDRRMRSVLRGDRGEGDCRRGDDEVGAMVLADREHVEAELVGELGLLEQVAHPLLGADARGEVGEGGKSKFHTNEDSTIVVRTTIARTKGPEQSARRRARRSDRGSSSGAWRPRGELQGPRLGGLTAPVRVSMS